MTRQEPHPFDLFVDAIANAVVAKLKPILEQTQGVQPRLLTVAQTALLLSRTEKAVRSLAASGAFPAVRADGRVMFDIHDLDRWIKQNKTEAE